MAWFGAKGPLRFGVINEDLWFPTAFSMVEYLNVHFIHDSSKQHYIIDPVVAAVIRKKPRKKSLIKGCKSAHVIAFHPDGTFSKCDLIDDSEESRILNFGGDDISDDDNVKNEKSEIEDVEEYEDEINDDDEVNIDTSMIFSWIDEGSYVAIRSPVGSLDFFFIMKILKKGIATENMSESANEHFVLEGESYLIGRWYSFQYEKKSYVQYEAKNTEDALINVAEVFHTNIEINENFQMNINDYHISCC